MNLVSELLENKRSVREIIDSAVMEAETSISLGDETDSEDSDALLGGMEVNDDPDATYRQLFVRRFQDDPNKPKRFHVVTPLEAINLYFKWIKQYPNERVEIWSNTAQTVQNFYKFCLANRKALETQWKQSPRLRQAGLRWTPELFKTIRQRANKSGAQFLGTLYPFEINGKD